MVQFIDMWRGHPINESVMTPCIAPRDLTNIEGHFVAEGLPVFHNQCAIRMGTALRRGGVSISQLGRVSTCAVHAKEDIHTINANQLANAINSARIPGFGEREIISGADVREFYPKLFGRTGVIYIQDYWMRTSDSDRRPTGDHIDVWNGYRSSAKWLLEWFSWAGYYSNYADAKEIWFWPVS